MTRPPIVRADTLDLQDQSSPSAQDHHHHKPVRGSPLGVGAAAPHQAAELRHVQHERAAEEESLSRAWHNAHDLSEDPPSDEETVLTPSANGTHHNDEQQQQNGTHGGGDSDADMADADADADADDGLDDDMLDKISSSPSISDAKSARQNQASCNRMASDESSPDSEPSLYSLRRSRAVRQRPATPHVGRCQVDDSASSSPYTSSPDHYPLCLVQEPATPSKDHHRAGEYPMPGTSMDRTENNERQQELNLRSDAAANGNPPPPLLKSESDIALESHLLPLDDPLLDADGEVDDTPGLLYTSPLAPPSSDDDEWETESGGSEDSIYCGNNRSNGSFLLETIDDDPVGIPVDDHFIDYGWGCECLRELEDIDFEFVYALHTFVATVEGQANAIKGDTMVLLDDSNSYWWLVRVVKDSTIGYLPAEHIETPTERLARLNKHRNIDLSATMLGDTAEKSKNYLKNAMRRRNAKKVQFGGHSYVEASEHEYSSDDEDDNVYTNGDGPTSEEVNGNGAAPESQDQDEIAVAPLNVRGPGKDRRSPSPEKKDTPDETGEDDARRKGVDQGRPGGDDAPDRQGPSKSRLGTIRNTDSFFKDEATETRKITLTPGLLRDDGAVVRSIDGKERGGSFEILDTGKTSLEKNRDDKKKRDKKPGMLSGLFKKKDKKLKSAGDTGSPQKVSEELSRESPTIESGETSPTNAQPPQRKPSNGKLHKTPPGASPVSPSSPTPNSGLRPLVLPSEQAQRESPATNSVSPSPNAQSPNSLPLVQPSLRVETDSSDKSRSPSDQAKQEKTKRATTKETDAKVANPFADPDDEAQPTKHASPDDAAERLSESPVHITSADAVPDSEPPALVGDSSSNSSTDELTSLRSSPSPQRPTTANTATSTDTNTAAAADTNTAAATDTNTAAATDTNTATTTDTNTSIAPDQRAPDQRAQASPISPSHQTPTSPLSTSRPRSPPPHPQRASPAPPTTKPTDQSAVARQNATTPPSLSRTPSNGVPPAWNDVSLRAYLDDAGATEVRELLQLVYDTSGVVPVAAEHPLVADLFVEERGKVRKLGVELDGLLNMWLERKRVKRGGKI